MTDKEAEIQELKKRLDELERLGKLRDSGVLTEEEFQAQKEKALRRRTPLL